MRKWSKYRIRYRQHLCNHVFMWLTFLLLSFSLCSRHTPSPSLSLIRHGWIPFVFARPFSTHTHSTGASTLHAILGICVDVLSHEVWHPNLELVQMEQIWGTELKHLILYHTVQLWLVLLFHKISVSEKMLPKGLDGNLHPFDTGQKTCQHLPAFVLNGNGYKQCS